MPRIFFAVHITGDIRDRLEGLQKRLETGHRAIKWVEKENLHLTLQFLGNVSPEQLDAILRRAALTGENLESFVVEIRGVGAFPTPARPRVLWAGVGQGATGLSLLAARLFRCLSVSPDKPFSPHLTLGRVREGHQVRLQEALSRENDFFAGSFKVESFECMESVLTPHGPVYSSVANFLLK
jgi:2'-5' RNA ligase